MAPSERQVSELETEIKRYLKQHPNAADCVEGIAAWWVVKPGEVDCLEAVTTAVDRMVRLGEMRKELLPDGRVVYSGATRDLK